MGAESERGIEVSARSWPPECEAMQVEREIMGAGRVLAVDAGERRVGLAMSDELRLLATPLKVLRRGDHGLAGVVAEIGEIVRREGVAQVVVGLPLDADGTHGRQARRAERVAEILQRALDLSVVTWDERLSTQEAEEVLRAQGRSLKRLRQRGEIDAVAAAVILQDYLDARRREADRRARLTDLQVREGAEGP